MSVGLAKRRTASDVKAARARAIQRETEKNGQQGFGTTVIPNRGAWLELETDAKNLSYARIDRTRKIPFTVVVRA